MIPVKPFETYKWRWLSTTPTEGLLEPPVLLGVLRALSQYEGSPPSIAELASDLAVVETETGTDVDLVRTPERNLIRNSGQYWKGLGLLLPVDGLVELSEFGRNVAHGRLTKDDFAATVIREAVLPNPWTYSESEIGTWRSAGLEIRPLALILAILERLRESDDDNSAFLTPKELVAIVIPLAAATTSPVAIADSVLEYRLGTLNTNRWPDCAPASNDRRMAREFLVFLSNFGACRREAAARNEDERYWLIEPFDLAQLNRGPKPSLYSVSQSDQLDAVAQTAISGLSSFVGRSRRLVSVLDRSGQSVFRDEVLDSYCRTCLVSGEAITDVLEAAHIIPVKHGGADSVSNGLCLRVDIHRLFDAGRIRLKPNGDLVLDDAVKASENYRWLPASLSFPNFVVIDHLAWRYRYL